MSVMETQRLAVADVPSHALIEELHERGDALLTIRVLRNRMPWWRRFQLGPNVWGLSGKWFAVCPWNGNTAWIRLPFLYFGAGTMNVELRLGGSTYGLTFDVRWRWE